MNIQRGFLHGHYHIARILPRKISEISLVVHHPTTFEPSHTHTFMTGARISRDVTHGWGVRVSIITYYIYDLQFYNAIIGQNERMKNFSYSIYVFALSETSRLFVIARGRISRRRADNELKFRHPFHANLMRVRRRARARNPNLTHLSKLREEKFQRVHTVTINTTG